MESKKSGIFDVSYRAKIRSFKRYFILVFSACTAMVAAQSVGSDAGVSGIYNLDRAEWEFRKEDLKNLSKSGLNRQSTIDLFEQVRTYQEQQGENLGLEVGLRNTNAITFAPNRELEEMEVRITTDSLASILFEKNHRFEFPEIDTELVSLGKGANQASFIMGLVDSLAYTTQQSLDPIDIVVSPIIVDRVLARMCGDGSQSCFPSGIKVDKQGLIDAASVKDSSSAATKRCSTAQKIFRMSVELEADTLHRANEQWDDSSEARKAAIEFDKACLKPADTLPAGLLDKFAILKAPNGVHPFCGAIRIGPQQFLTAMHCFQDNEGRPIVSRISGAEVYMYRNPTIAISFDAAKPPEINNNNGFTTPSFRDFAIVSTEKFDNAKLEDFDELVGEASLGSVALIPGYYLYHIPEELVLNKNISALSKDWTKGVRVDGRTGKSSCILVDAAPLGDSACIIHNCQVLPGFSGSPVVQIQNGKTELVGIHVHGEDGVATLDHNCSRSFRLGKAAHGSGVRPILSRANIATHINTNNLENLGWISN